MSASANIADILDSAFVGGFLYGVVSTVIGIGVLWIVALTVGRNAKRRE